MVMMIILLIIIRKMLNFTLLTMMFVLPQIITFFILPMYDF